MEKILMSDLQSNKKLQFLNDKSFFEGTIIKLYEKYFGVQILITQDHFKIINANEHADFLLVFDEEAFWCKSKVIGCTAGDNSQLLVLDQPQIVNKIERREYKRIQALIDIEYLVASDGIKSVRDIPPMLLRQMKKTFTLDLSGGGVALVTYDKFEEGKEVLISLEIKEKIIALCTVIRSEKNDMNYRTGLKFKEIDDEQRQLIVQYVNAKLKNGIETIKIEK